MGILEKKRLLRLADRECYKKDNREIHLTTASPTDKRTLESLYV